MKYQAVVFDLLSGLLNSWTLWGLVAGSTQAGMRWRQEYLKLTCRAGRYRSYEGIVREAAKDVGVSLHKADELMVRWRELEPWPETNQILHELIQRVPVAVATNSSNRLAEIAVSCTGVSIPFVITAEQAGYYKPAPRPYRLALERVGMKAEQVLFVAGSPFDISGASGVGMRVFWHNRLRLKQPDDGTEPQYESDTLLPLLDIVEA